MNFVAVAVGLFALTEIIGRNVASVLRPPKVDAQEIQTLTGSQIASVLTQLGGHPLHSIVAVALGTGMRRGELCALRWGDVDLDAPMVRVERSMEETKAGLRVKAAKSRHGRRAISLPGSAVDALRSHWLRQIELRLALGMGRLGRDDQVFAMPDGAPRSPDNLSRDWRRAVITLKRPPVMFHALRHTHASALIAAGLNVLMISRRFRHGAPAFTLTVHGHLFSNADAAASHAIDAAMAGT